MALPRKKERLAFKHCSWQLCQLRTPNSKGTSCKLQLFQLKGLFSVSHGKPGRAAGSAEGSTKGGLADSVKAKEQQVPSATKEGLVTLVKAYSFYPIQPSTIRAEAGGQSDCKVAQWCWSLLNGRPSCWLEDFKPKQQV